MGVLALLSLQSSAIAASRAGAQVLPGESKRDHVQMELRRYRELVREYRGGNDNAAAEIVLWDRNRVEGVLASVGIAKGEAPLEPLFYKAAGMLHTDGALRLMMRSEIATALQHIRLAGDLLKHAEPDLDGYSGRWVRAVVQVLRSRGLLPTAEQVLEMARKLWPADPSILYESGALQEYLASDATVPNVIYLPDLRVPSPNAHTRAAQTTAPLTRADLDDLMRRRAAQLNRAARWLRESLEGNPANVLARLRLGRVQTLRSKHDEALELLQEAAVSDDTKTSYLALLFSAALHERRGRFAEADSAYRQAIERQPLNHAAFFGLSALLQREGRGAESRAVLARVVDSVRQNREDPWWSYFIEPPRVLDARLDALRREVRQ